MLSSKIKAAIKQEREECVQIALEYRDRIDNANLMTADNAEHLLGQGYAANCIAKLIRNRGKDE